jgi:hypothetical protein
LEKGVESTRNALTLETKMLVNRKMGACEKRARVCSSLGLAPDTVSIRTANAEKDKTVFTENYKIAFIKCKLR